MRISTRFLPCIAATVLIATSAACVVTEQPNPELSTLQVNLVANAAANVDHFDLSLRELGTPTWTTQSLPATVGASRAVASSLLSLNPGEYVLRAEAFDNVGTLLGQPREVRVSLFQGSIATVDIELDLADFPGEGEASANVAISGQNGASIDQSTLVNTNPTDAISATVNIDAVSDAEGDPIRTGFVSVSLNLNVPEFFSETSTDATFTLDLAAGSEQTLYAIAVDDSSFGTAHAYVFDPAASPSFQRRDSFRVNDVRSINGGNNDLLVLSNNTPTMRVFGDFDGDGAWDFGLDAPGQTLLSWGPSALAPNIYDVRFMDNMGVVTVGSLDFSSGALTTVLE